MSAGAGAKRSAAASRRRRRPIDPASSGRIQGDRGRLPTSRADRERAVRVPVASHNVSPRHEAIARPRETLAAGGRARIAAVGQGLGGAEEMARGVLEGGAPKQFRFSTSLGRPNQGKNRDHRHQDYGADGVDTCRRGAADQESPTRHATCDLHGQTICDLHVESQGTAGGAVPIREVRGRWRGFLCPRWRDATMPGCLGANKWKIVRTTVRRGLF